MSFSDSDSEMHPVEFIVNGDITMSYTDPGSFSGIIKAVIVGDLNGVKLLVKKGKSVNVCDNRGNTPLHIAAITNKLAIVDYLLSLPSVRIDVENHEMQTPLYVSCRSHRTEAALKLIQAGADVNICSNNFVSPLHLALYSEELVKSLIVHGAVIDAKDYSGDTPLSEAVKDGSHEAAAALLYYGADANIACDYGITPFMYSLIGMKNDMQELLLNYELDFNRKTNENMSTLVLAITGQSPYLEEIINKGANVNFALDDVYNPLYLSLNYSNFDTFKTMWKYCNYSKVWLCKSRNIINFILTEDTLNINKLNCLTLIINSDKLGEVISSSSDSDIIYNLVAYFSGTELEKLSGFVYLICSAGYIPLYKELRELFFHYGYCNVFKFLRFVFKPKDGMNLANIYYFSQLSFVICHPCINIIQRIDKVDLETHLQYRNPLETRVKNMKLILRYFIWPLNFFSQNYEFRNILLNGRNEMTRVPSLLELARNSTRRAICMEEKYNINNCSSFYTVLNCLNISSEYKKIIALETPIY